jgi:hypothetical protein
MNAQEFAQRYGQAQTGLSQDWNLMPARRAIMTHIGMTLRDYFAAKAMQAVVLKQNELHDIQAMYDRLALHAYKVADAMLKARDSE